MKRELLVVLVLIGSGCAQQNGGKTTGTSPGPALRALGQSVTTEEARSDEAIGLEIRSRLDSAGLNQTSGVIVEISDGVVTLRGVAGSLAAAWRAEAAARGVKGVKQVFNRILVTGTGP
jgi:osmotically-inducible protein OsmY